MIAAGVLFAGGTAKAQNQYQVLESLYGSQFPGSTATAAYWNQYLTSGKTFLGSGFVTVQAEVAFSGGKNFILGTTAPDGSAYSSYGAITGSTTGTGTGPYNSSGVHTYVSNGLTGTVAGTFFQTGTGGTTPPIGTVGFTPSANPFSFTVSALPKGTIFSGETIAAYNAANGTSFTSFDQLAESQTLLSSSNTADMVAYRLVLNGQIHYILMWNTDGAGDLTSGNYTSLVFDVTGVQNPEPASLALMGFGALGLLGYKIRRRGKTDAAPQVAA
jgi:hypothetical protein